MKSPLSFSGDFSNARAEKKKKGKQCPSFKSIKIKHRTVL